MFKVVLIFKPRMDKCSECPWKCGYLNQLYVTTAFTYSITILNVDIDSLMNSIFSYIKLKWPLSAATCKGLMKQQKVRQKMTAFSCNIHGNHLKMRLVQTLLNNNLPLVYTCTYSVMILNVDINFLVSKADKIFRYF